jgi:ParB/RepB/Spo0J family partition protein
MAEIEIKDIATASIDPKSTVNVRRSQIEEGVEKVKLSIAEHGFLRNFPITVRPHPDSSSEYEYEIVVGQCRLKACLELGIERFPQIPAFVQKLNDDEAICLSWGEGEHRTDLTMGDKFYWANRIMTKYLTEGKNKGESCRLAAKFLGVSSQTVAGWAPLVALPEDVAEKIDGGSLKVEDAKAIVQSCVGAQNDELDQKIRERAEWIIPLDKPHKEAARKLLKDRDVNSQTSIDDLDKKLADETKNITVEVTIPAALRGRLLEWGDSKGLIGADEAVIISNMVVTVLSGKI